MSENQNQNNNPGQPVGNNNVDLIKNLTNNLQNNENSIDLNSLFKIAAPLLKNEAVMNSVMEVSKKRQSTDVKTEKSSTNINSKELSLLTAQLEKLGQEISGLKAEITNGLSQVSKSDEIANIKSELLEVKNQNLYLTGIVEELYQYRKKKKK